jgi:hypothetical protein
VAETKNQAQRAGAGLVRNADHAGELIGSEHTLSAPDLQRFRAAWLARRAPLSPQTARAVISVYFGDAL